EAVVLVGGEFDVVLTDLMLGGAINGNEVTRRFRARGFTDVIIMTAYPQLDSAIQGLRDGAYDYIAKPVSEEYLRVVVARCLEKRRLSTELAREKELRAELNRAYSELAGLSRVRDLFGQFATPEVADFVMKHPEDFWTRGERRLVTVLFADVRSFTVYAASVPPEQATAALNEVFGVLQDALRAEGGILNKFLGDGAMALFGAPIPLRGHETAAVRSALRAQEGFAALAERRRARGLAPLGVGIGINTGTVVAGCLGSKTRTEYSVIGAPINLAARLEKVAEAGQVLVGPETAAALGGEFELRDLGARAFHGIPEAVMVRMVSGRAGVAVAALGRGPAR
ncbi:MAG: adenylate/guanylate cyclase domain-containing protein, partial [Elusimicrobia bacterium]|nr:adenylate/guanylate cyclase domain-containing protein [Elusimicrobiota bacterium]